MPTTKPYPHIYRHGNESVNRPFKESQKSSLAKRFLQSFEIIKRDLQRLFEFIEPCNDNYLTYSQRTFELLLRACTEIESNCKQILRANNQSVNDVNILRFSDLNGPMKLSEYVVCCPAIDFDDFSPFESFAHSDRQRRSPSWYRAYNEAKHDRAHTFSSAHLKNVIESIGAVYIILSAQYGYHFDGGLSAWNGISLGPPKYFSLRAHPKWPDDESYQFDWTALSSTNDPYDYHPVPQIP
jgi:hypothetical protein